jgi:hypothetical protein
MSQLYETIRAILARGPRAADEIVAECRRAGLTCRGDTIAVYLRLSHECVERNGIWRLGGKPGVERIASAVQRAFASGQTYVAMDRLSEFFDDAQPVTADDIGAACEELGGFRVQGRIIVRCV